MHPILWRIGPLTVFTYGFLLAVAFLAAIAMSGREARRVGQSATQIYDLCFYLVVAALVGSRLGQILLEWPRYWAHPLDMVKVWDGGLAFQGGLLLALIVAFLFMLWHRLSIWGTLDILAVGVPLGHSIGRIGCLMAGCCYGRPTTLPWAVTFTHPETLGPRGVPVHPTQLYESLLYLGVFGVILWLRKRKRFQGELFGTYLLLAGLARFGVEFFRGDDRGPLILAGMPVTQVIALITMLVGALLLTLGFCRQLPGCASEDVSTER